MHNHRLPWLDPITIARRVYQNGGDMVFLYSGMMTEFTGRYSYIAFDPERSIAANNFKEFEQVLSQKKLPFDNAWFGYLGYGLKDSLEQLPSDTPSYIDTPALWMTKFKQTFVFDHLNKECVLYCQEKDPSLLTPIITPFFLDIKVNNIYSSMNKETYLEHIQTTLDAIHRGDLYQANITRKFYGELDPTRLNHFEVFNKLSSISPSPYSSFIKFNDLHIISSSPEQFLSINASGKATSRPIKGSAPRYHNRELDEKSFQALKESAKDQMENLMIVDLMRNDLARSSIPGSVKVKSLFDVTSYSTIHHMSSTIESQKKSEVTPLSMVQYAFPPGSMTGAPKIKAMQLCSELEKQARGIYSGTIGWFGGDGSVDLSVVIRTLIFEGNKFEFQVGGAVVADSTPINEWQETILKAKAIAQVLNLQADKDLLF